jgi:hypothetical protein
MVLKYDAIGCSRIPIHNVRLSPNKSDSALGVFNGRFKFTFFLSTLISEVANFARCATRRDSTGANIMGARKELMKDPQAATTTTGTKHKSTHSNI